jgi:uncharacterized protein YebE (UPF0316 family)
VFFDSAWLPLIIFCSRIVDVSLGTVRIICMVRGYRAVAVILAFFEVTVWVYAVAGVFTHLDRLINVFAYAAGFTAGCAVGMWIEQKLALGTQMISVYSRSPGAAITEALRGIGLNAATLNGNGHHEPVTVTVALVPRKRISEAVARARANDPSAHVAVTDVRDLPTGHNGTATRARFPFNVIPGPRPHRSRSLNGVLGPCLCRPRRLQ